MAPYNSYGPFAQMEELGLFDVILPFILIFVLVFAFLQKTKILGTDSKRFNSVVALVMGLSVVFPHVLGYYPADKDIVNIINQALPNVSVVVVAIVMALLLIGVMGRRFQLAKNSLSGWIALISFGGILYIFGDAAGWWDSPTWLYFLQDSETVTLIVSVLVFGIIIWFITKEDEASKLKRMKDIVYKGKDADFTAWKTEYDKRKFAKQMEEMLVDPKGK